MNGAIIGVFLVIIAYLVMMLAIGFYAACWRMREFP